MSAEMLDQFIQLQQRGAIISEDRKYRYALWRSWRAEQLQLPKRWVLIVGLNPSTANETVPDPTMTKCREFAKLWGYEAMVMANLFPLRTKDPKVMKAAGPEVFGDHNFDWLNYLVPRAHKVVAAWGRDGNHRDAGEGFMGRYGEIEGGIHCLGTNKDGTPKHPLYLSYETALIPYEYDQ